MVDIITNIVGVGITCPICGKGYIIEVPKKGFIAWRDGELVQNAFPMLSADERESLISDLCSDCQADIFG